MRRFERIILAVATIGFSAVPLLQAAENASGPTTQAVRATLEARRVEVRGERYCVGSDGVYRFAHEIYEGTSTGDEEISGTFVLEIHAADNVSLGFQGLATGNVKVVDPITGRLKLAAQVSAVDSLSLDPLGVKVDGFVSGQIFTEPAAGKQPTGTGAKALFANFSVLLDTTAAFVGNIGADVPVPSQNTAVIQDAGGCVPLDSR
jgi:hypothetical protein